MIQAIPRAWRVDARLQRKSVAANQSFCYRGCQLGALHLVELVGQCHLELAGNRAVLAILSDLGGGPKLAGHERPVGRSVRGEADGLYHGPTMTVVVAATGEVIDQQQTSAIRGGCDRGVPRARLKVLTREW